MLHIGCHLSSSDGFLAMGKTALSIGADVFQFLRAIPVAAGPSRWIPPTRRRSCSS